MVGRLAGVDGCRGGWLVVMGRGPQDYDVEVFGRWSDLPFAALSCIAVDMPIGLAEEGRRRCDSLARQALPVGRKSCVFATPARGQLDMKSYAAANAWGRATYGRGLPVQTWHILPKIRELDRALTAADQSLVHEAHPEVAFQRLAGPNPLPPKRRRAGVVARLALLEAAGFRGLEEARRQLPRSAAKVDDLLDAAVLLITAGRIAAGSAVRLPPKPERDARGLDMAIWF